MKKNVFHEAAEKLAQRISCGEVSLELVTQTAMAIGELERAGRSRDEQVLSGIDFEDAKE